jgi:EAL and modified HD-GYP domain-containing signal transduction protein
MQHAFVARQPIFDQELRVHAYELLFRGGEHNAAGPLQGEAATSQVLLNTFTVFGLDALVDGRQAFVNVTRDLLLGEMPRSLPAERVVLEILEDVAVDAALVEAVARLQGLGYRFALDDFVYHPQWQPLIELASIVKLDVLGRSATDIAAQVRLLRRDGLVLLAEKVETEAQYRELRALGFELFQGYFFARPTVLKGNRPPESRLAVLRLLGRLQDPEVEVAEVEQLVAHDLSLSYRLLRYLNSAMFGLPRRVESVRQALVFLGLEELRRWLTLAALSGLNDRPGDQLRTALLRAKACQHLAEAAGLEAADTHFTVGLFSALDMLLELPMEQVVAELPLSEPVCEALLAGTGPYAPTLACALAHERRDWEGTCNLGLDPGAIRDAYLSAMAWSNLASSELSGAG